MSWEATKTNFDFFCSFLLLQNQCCNNTVSFKLHNFVILVFNIMHFFEYLYREFLMSKYLTQKALREIVADDIPFFYTPPHDNGGYYMVSCWLSVCPSICLSIHHISIRLYFRFRMITWVNISRFSPNFVCALLLWISGLALVMGRFLHFLTELSTCHISIFSFPGDNFSKYQWIFIKLAYVFILCWSALALLMGKFCQFLTFICLQHICILVSG